MAHVDQVHLGSDRRGLLGLGVMYLYKTTVAVVRRDIPHTRLSRKPGRGRAARRVRDEYEDDYDDYDDDFEEEPPPRRGRPRR